MTQVGWTRHGQENYYAPTAGDSKPAAGDWPRRTGSGRVMAKPNTPGSGALVKSLTVPSSISQRRSGLASWPSGPAQNRQRTPESQSIESSRHPCVRPPTCSCCDIRTGKSPSNVIGQKYSPSVAIPQHVREELLARSRVCEAEPS